MSIFSLTCTDGATLQPWSDSATPSRLIQRAGVPALAWTAVVGTPVEVSVVYDRGVLADPDDWWMAVYPGEIPSITDTVGGASAAESVVVFTPNVAGEYIIGARFAAWGACLMQITAVDP